MPKVSPIQTSFAGGEWSPLAIGRVDSDRYKQGLGLCENYLPTLQGPLIRRPGTYFAAATKNSAKKSRLVKFEFSTTQAYILEFGDQYIRFYKDHGQIVSGGSPVEIATPYLEADLFGLKFNQSADTLYITHVGYAPRKLTRASHTSWSLSTITFTDGPYLPLNKTTTTINLGSLVGATFPFSFSGTTNVNSGAGLSASDVGRHIRIYNGSNIMWGVISAVTNATQGSINVQGGTMANGYSTGAWRLGAWADSVGYPSACTFHEDRLVFVGAPEAPLQVAASCTSDYENMSISDMAGTIVSSNGYNFTLASNSVNRGRWVTSDEKGINIGTNAGPWNMRSSSFDEAITPTNVRARTAGSKGAADVSPVQIGKATLYLQRSKKKIRELTYFYDVEGFRAEDMTELAEHITGTGIVEMTAVEEPHPALIAIRNDGQVPLMVYERGPESLKVAWARQILGGTTGTGHDSIAVVESAAAIPSSDGTYDEVWFLVRRKIGGSTYRYVEYLKPLFDENSDFKQAFFVDCGLSLDNPKTITGISTANPAVVTSAAHGFSNGDEVLVDEVLGLEDSSTFASGVNNLTFTVANSTTNTFELAGLNTTTFSPYISGGKVRKKVSTVSGLSHLEGQTVAVHGDGIQQATQVVSSGAITLESKAAVVHVGLPYTSRFRMLRLEAGAADGTARGKTQRVHALGVEVLRTYGLSFGPAFDKLTDFPFPNDNNLAGLAPPLYTGMVRESFDSDYDTNIEICFAQTGTYPGTIMAAYPTLHTEDR